jgi:hypothetical protein
MADAAAFDLRWVRWGLGHVDEVERIASEHIPALLAHPVVGDKIRGLHPIVDEVAVIADDCPAFTQTFGAAPICDAAEFGALQSQAEARGIDWAAFLEKLEKVMAIIERIAPIIIPLLI